MAKKKTWKDLLEELSVEVKDSSKKKSDPLNKKKESSQKSWSDVVNDMNINVTFSKDKTDDTLTKNSPKSTKDKLKEAVAKKEREADSLLAQEEREKLGRAKEAEPTKPLIVQLDEERTGDTWEYIGNKQWQKTTRFGQKSTVTDTENKKEWYEEIFQAPGTFKDGLDWYDVPATILGTAGDAVVDLGKGAAKVGEGIGTWASARIFDIADALGADEWADERRAFMTSESKKGSLVDRLASPVDNFLDDYSVLGKTGDEAAETVGQIGANVAAAYFGGTPLTTAVNYASSAGHNQYGALANDADWEEARLRGQVGGAIDAGTEMLAGGLGKGANALGISRGIGGLDDLIAKKASSNIANKWVGNAVEGVVKAALEGGEEVLAGLLQAKADQKIYRQDENYWDLVKEQELGKAGFLGMLGSGVAQVPSYVSSSKAGRGMTSGYTDAEQSVIDKEVENRIAEKEKDGKKLTNKEKGKIIESVEEAMKEGEISIDTIEEVLGGDSYKAYQEAVDSDNALLQEYIEQYEGDDLQSQVDEFMKTAKSTELKNKLSEEVQGKVKDSYLSESYLERGRRKEKFTVDMNEIDEKQRATYQRAIDSGVLNNTRRTRKFVDILSRMEADKGVLFDFVNNDKIKETGFSVEGKQVNGYIDDNGNVVINVESPKAWQTTVGHEITHVLENTDLYQTLQDTLFEYAKSKKASSADFASEFDERIDAIKKLYSGVKGYDGVNGFQKIKKELAADLVGDYLFTDENFVRHLSTKNRNVFQKMYDEVKYMLKVATAGSKEAKQLEKVKKVFDDVWKAEVKGQKNTADNSGVTLSISRTKDMSWSEQIKGALYGGNNIRRSDTLVVGQAKDTAVSADISNKPLAIPQSVLTKASSGKDISHSIKRGKLAKLDEGIKNAPITIYNPDRNAVVYITDIKQGGLPIMVSFDLDATFDGDKVHQATSIHLQVDTMSMLENLPESATVYVQKNELDPVGATNNLRGLAAKIKFIDGTLSQEKPNVNRQYSLSDSDGKQLTKGQQEYFKDSKMRDENGNLKVMYHGSQKGGFYTFDPDYSDDGTSLFFVDRNEVAMSYSGTSETFAPKSFNTADEMNSFFADIDQTDFEVVEKDGSYTLYEDGDEVATSENLDEIFEEFKDWAGVGYGDVNYKVYLNLKNPYIVDANGAFWSELYDEAVSNHFYNKPDSPLNTREIADFANVKGYDGVIFKNINDNGGFSNGSEGASTVAIAFDSNQVKSVANENPTGDSDIRYSLSEDSEGRELSKAVKNRFAKSKVTDENGALKVVYHGTPSGEFSIFDKAKGSVEGDFGNGFYFTDNEYDVSNNYEGGGPDFDNKVARRAEQIQDEEDIDYEEAEERARNELFKGSHKFEVYLNIENPAIVGETLLFDGESYLGEYNEEDYDSYDDYIGDVEQLLADDIENIVWEVEKNVDVYNIDGLADILYEAYSEGGIGIEELKEKINNLYLEDSNGNLVGNEVARQIIESLGYDGIIDPTVSTKWNMDMESDTTHYIVFKPNQIKSVTNQNPTDDPDIHLSLSKNGEKQKAYGNFATPANELMYEGLPIREDAAPQVQEEVPAVDDIPIREVAQADVEDDLFPDDLISPQEELDNLYQRRDALEDRMIEIARNEDYEALEKINAEYDSIQSRIVELEADESERFDSLDDADAPPIMETVQDSTTDIVPLTKKLVDDIARDVRQRLGLKNPQMAEVRNMIEQYARSEMPSREELFNELKTKFGKFKESFSDESVKEAKSFLRTYGLKVSDSIKQEIPDYANVMRKLRGRIRFSNDGTPVDMLYHELSNLYPHLFPESIYVPTDQFERMVDVAYMDNVTETESSFDDESILETADAIIHGVNEYKQNQRLKAANKYGRESFNGLMQDADQYVPPIDYDKIINQRKASAEKVSAPETFDATPRRGVGEGQQALFEDTTPEKVTRKVLHERILDNIKTKFAEKGFDFDEVLKNAKNLSTFSTVDNIPQRVMEKALGYKQGQILSDMTVNQVAQNETKGIKWLNSFTDRKSGWLANLSKKYHIKPGSKESAAAQMYAEGFYVDANNDIVQYGDAELAKDFPNIDIQKRIKGLARDPLIRQIYDYTLSAINESRTRNAYPEIPRLDNYFLHFRAMDDTFSKLGLPFNPNDIRAKDLPTDLNGVTADLKPGQPYFASAKHREGKRTSFDLLGGLERYLSSAKNQIYHIDDIQTLRALRNYIADTFGQANGLEGLDLLSEEEAQERIEQVYGSHLSTFAKFLNEEANVIAGKTALIDRGLEGIIGRRGMTFFDTVNKQVGSNMVGMNVSSSLTNFLAGVQAIAKTNKFASVKALAQTASSKIQSIFGKTDSFVENNPTIIRRKGAERFYRTPFQKIGDAGYVLMSAVDDITTEFIVRAKYNEYISKGMSEQQAITEADKWTSRLMGDRSLGQQPQLYNSKMLGLLTKFQLEVRNQLDSQFYDTIQEANASTEDIKNGLARNAKKAAKVTSTFFQLAVLQNAFGKAFESVAGYNPAFDIISVIATALGFDDDEESEDTALDNIEQAFLELLGDLPYTSTFTGGRIPISSALPIKELVTGKDQYGNEKNRWETIKEAAPYYFLPTGYGQIKKTQQGLSMFDDDLPISGSYTDSGNLRFPVEDTLGNRIQAGLFGQYASENARDYFDNERSPLKEKQIQEFIDSDLPIRDYWEYREGLSGLDKLSEKADYIDSLDLPIDTKNLFINNIAGRKEDIDMEDYGEYESFGEFDFAHEYPEKYEFLQDKGVSYDEYLADKEEYDFEYKYPEKYKFLKRNGITAKDYNAFDKDTKEAYSWAYENPGKFTMSKAISNDFLEFNNIRVEMNDIAKNNDSSSGTKDKDLIIDYINGLDLDYGQKIILYRSKYSSKQDKADYNQDIIDYLNSRDDISYEEMETILLELGFKVDSEGYITWD